MDVDVFTSTYGEQNMVDAEFVAKNRARKFTGSGTPHKNGENREVSGRAWPRGRRRRCLIVVWAVFYYDAVNTFEFTYNNLPSAANRWVVWPRMRCWVCLISQIVRVFGAPCHINCTDEATFEAVDRNGENRKGLRRGCRGALIGMIADVRVQGSGFGRQRLVCNERVVVPDHGILPVQNFVKDLRMSPFTAGKSKDAKWVWSIYDRQPRVELLVEPTVDNDGNVWDVLDEFGLPLVAPPPSDGGEEVEYVGPVNRGDRSIRSVEAAADSESDDEFEDDEEDYDDDEFDEDDEDSESRCTDLGATPRDLRVEEILPEMGSWALLSPWPRVAKRSQGLRWGTPRGDVGAMQPIAIVARAR